MGILQNFHRHSQTQKQIRQMWMLQETSSVWIQKLEPVTKDILRASGLCQLLLNTILLSVHVVEYYYFPEYGC